MAKNVIAFLVFPELTLLDLVGPLQVIKSLERHGPFEVVTVGERVEPMLSDTGLLVQPERSFADVQRPFALVVPGGVLGPFKAMVNEAVMAYVRDSAESATVVGSVCTGSLILAAAGLLDGRKATTHWSCLGQLAQLGATPVEQRWVEDGKFITAAGVSAGIDMALALAARLTNENAARAIQLGIEYSPAPPFGDIDRTKLDVPAIQRRMDEMFRQQIPAILAPRPDLLARLLA